MEDQTSLLTTVISTVASREECVPGSPHLKLLCLVMLKWYSTANTFSVKTEQLPFHWSTQLKRLVGTTPAAH